MNCTELSPALWDDFLKQQRYSPFLQSSAMKRVYEATNQACTLLGVENNGEIIAGCLAVTVPARRGKHMTIPYGPVLQDTLSDSEKKGAINALLETLSTIASRQGACFLRLSPHWSTSNAITLSEAKKAPLHLLAEHIWYLPLRQDCRWEPLKEEVTQESLLMNMRKTSRNLVRRAERDGVTIQKSSGCNDDFRHFLRLHEETRKRHHFTPYTDEFFRAEVEEFSKIDACTVYTAWYEGECISASIHIHFNGETSYHHGASSSAHSKIPSSYLLQWQAICDAFERGDHVYNFWGIAPVQEENGKWHLTADTKNHPFAGVTTFKTGFGGTLLELLPCQDIPLSKKYYATRFFEQLRKWKRGF